MEGHAVQAPRSGIPVPLYALRGGVYRTDDVRAFCDASGHVYGLFYDAEVSLPVAAPGPCSCARLRLRWLPV